MRDVRLAASGLVTDPSPFLATPGAMVVADNVVAARTGLLSPRGSISTYVGAPVNSGDDVVGLQTNPKSTYVYSAWSDDSLYSGVTLVGGTAFDFTDGACVISHVGISTVDERSIIFDATSAHVYDYTNASTNTLAGMPRSVIISATLTNSTIAAQNWLTNAYYTAYRSVCRRIKRVSLDDDLSLPVVGAPSTRFVVKNTAGASRAVTMRVSTYGCAADDVIELYRAPLMSTTANGCSDEMRLVVSAKLTSTNISAGYVDLEDFQADANTGGATIYTGTTQQGILQSSYRPGVGTDLRWYNGYTFAANMRTPQRWVGRCSSLNPEVAAAPGPGTFLSYTLPSWGNLTSGSPTVTGVPAGMFPYLFVGMALSRTSNTDPSTADAYYPAHTVITALNSGAGTVTMNNNALATIANPATNAWDWIGVLDGSTKRRIYAPANKGFTDAATLESLWIQSHSASGIRLYADETSGQIGRDVSIVFERERPTETAFAVQTSKPQTFSDVSAKVQPTYDASVGSQIETSSLSYSKYLAPEEWPIVNTIDVGATVVRIAVAGESLFVFAQNGLWRINGTSDPFDLRLVNRGVVLRDANWLNVIGDTIYAWCTSGIFAVSESGIQRIDTAIRRSTLAMFGNTLPTSTWSMASSEHAIVAFGCSSSSTSSTPMAYVFNVNTNAWTTWSFRDGYQPTIGQYNQVIPGAVAVQPVFLGRQSSVLVYTDDNQQRLESFSRPLFTSDDSYSVTVSTVVGSTVTIAGGSGWTPAVGDLLWQGTVYARVVSVASSTVFDVDLVPVAGAATALVAFPVTLIWSCAAEGDVGVEKLYRRVAFAHTQSYGAADISLVARTWDGKEVGSEIIESSLTFSSNPVAAITEWDCPKNVSRTWAAQFGISYTQAGAYMDFAGISVQLNTAGERPARA